jgi:hypothetical protein
MANSLSRRKFISRSMLATSALAAGKAFASRAVAGDSTAKPAPANPLPTGKIGELRITRLILGGNLLTRYQHVRDLDYVSKLVKSYNTDAKIRETIELAEASGINTLSANLAPDVMKVLNDHRRNGGKIQWILYATSDIENFPAYRDDLRRMADNGAEAIYVWGVQADQYAASGQLGLISKAVEEINLLDVPCGLGAHGLQTVQTAEKSQLPVDFYVKTLHHHRYPSAPRSGEAIRMTSEVPGYWCKDPEETAAFMKSVRKPWIAFKVMAAGAIPPKDAFPYALSNGGDFVLAGMFDFDIAENCEIIRGAVAQCRTRPRPWMG